MIVRLNFSIKITVIVGFNITRSKKSYCCLVLVMSLYWLNQTAFDESKFNPTITTYLLLYIKEEINHNFKEI